MASITNRGEYQWRALIRRKGLPSISKTFPYKKDAEAWARKVETELKEGTYRDRTEGDQTSLSALLDRYLREVSSKKKGRGYECNRSQVRNIKKHPIADLPITQVQSADVAKYRDDRMEVVKPNTVRLELALISHLFTISQREWGMAYLTNPVAIIKKPSVAKTARDRRLVGDEEARLLESAKAYNQRVHVLIVVAIESAGRREELANLRWKNIKGNIATLIDTKNGETRDVLLTTRALEVIKTLPRQLNDDRVFGLSPDAATKAFKRVCKRAKSADGKKAKPIVGLRLHDLRHEAISRFYEKGLSTQQVMRLTARLMQCRCAILI